MTDFEKEMISYAKRLVRKVDALGFNTEGSADLPPGTTEFIAMHLEKIVIGVESAATSLERIANHLEGV